MSAAHMTGEDAAPASARAAVPHRHKTVAALLAFLLGGLGLHRRYLGSGWWWVYPVFLVTLVPVFVGFVEAIVFALTPDEKWDARWNPHSGVQSQSGWGPVLVAITTLIVGATLLMTTLAILFQTYFESLQGAA